ncbi:MAG: hypothetical protein H0W38_05595 [Methylibium sp.]|nr:hypothetical protein [Methylibium sp.]
MLLTTTPHCLDAPDTNSFRCRNPTSPQRLRPAFTDGNTVRVFERDPARQLHKLRLTVKQTTVSVNSLRLPKEVPHRLLSKLCLGWECDESGPAVHAKQL